MPRIYWGGCKLPFNSPYYLTTMIGASGYIKRSRLTMALHLGRALTKREVVHHIDKDRYNNKLKNLILFATHGEHMKHHWMLRKYPEFALNGLLLKPKRRKKELVETRGELC